MLIKYVMLGGVVVNFAKNFRYIIKRGDIKIILNFEKYFTMYIIKER